MTLACLILILGIILPHIESLSPEECQALMAGNDVRPPLDCLMYAVVLNRRFDVSYADDGAYDWPPRNAKILQPDDGVESYEQKRGVDRNFLRFGRDVDHSRSKREAITELSAEPEAKPDSVARNLVKRGQDRMQLLRLTLNPANLNLLREYSRKRGALDRNFLRFGRKDEGTEKTRHVRQIGDEDLRKKASVDRNFLRFGRSQMEDKRGVDRNFLRFGRDYEDVKRGVDRNFLRFGRGDEDVKRGVDRNFLRFGRDGDKRGVDRNFLRFGRDQEDFKRGVDRNFLRFGRRSIDGINATEMNPQQLEEYFRNNRNFLRFGRRDADFDARWQWLINRINEVDGSEADKRAAVDRNFLRFGRSIEDDHQEDEDFVQDREIQSFTNDFSNPPITNAQSESRNSDGNISNEISDVTENKMESDQVKQNGM